MKSNYIQQLVQNERRAALAKAKVQKAIESSKDEIRKKMIQQAFELFTEIQNADYFRFPKDHYDKVGAPLIDHGDVEYLKRDAIHNSLIRHMHHVPFYIIGITVEFHVDADFKPIFKIKYHKKFGEDLYEEFYTLEKFAIAFTQHCLKASIKEPA